MSEQPSVDLDVLRADYRLVRDWFVKYGEWAVAEGDEVGLAIAAAVKAGEMGELAFWSWWMARYAEMARAHQARMDELAAWSAGLAIRAAA